MRNNVMVSLGNTEVSKYSVYTRTVDTYTAVTSLADSLLIYSTLL